MSFDLIVKGGVLPDGKKADIGITGETITAIEPSIEAEAGRVVDASGCLVSPPFVDPHFHMDATLSYGIPRINASGTLLEGIALWGELKPLLTEEAVIERALAYCDWAVSMGLLAIRSHVDTSDDNAMTGVRGLLAVRDIVYRVNQAYIASAAQAEAYRTEPPFKLQGSYRNMSKLAGKVSAVMNAHELQKLMDDHYLGESQLLTGGAEENLLKLAEIRGTLDTARAERWQAIKQGFQRNKALGGADSDTGTRVIAQLHDLVASVQSLGERAGQAAPPATAPELVQLLQRILDEQVLNRTFSRDTASDAAMWLGGLRNALDVGFRPLVDAVQGSGQARSDAAAQQAELIRQLQALVGTLRGGGR